MQVEDIEIDYNGKMCVFIVFFEYLPEINTPWEQASEVYQVTNLKFYDETGASCAIHLKDELQDKIIEALKLIGESL